MQNGANTHTLLEAQDIHHIAEYRPAPAPRRHAPERKRPTPHDFLVLNARPDLTPEFFPARAGKHP